MDRIKRLSMEVLGKHKSKFGEDFSDNKKTLDQITIIRSKGLKNEIAGYITKYIKHEIHDKKIKHAETVKKEKQELNSLAAETSDLEGRSVTESKVSITDDSITETPETTTQPETSTT